MRNAVSGSSRADYGLDAPGVVRNLFLAAAIGLCLWASVSLKLWSGVVRLNLGAVTLIFPLGMIGLLCAISFSATGL